MYNIDEENSEILFEVVGDKLILKLKKGSGTETGASSVYVIKKGEPTLPTDENIFSSFRTLAEVDDRALSKLKPDTAQKLIKFLEGLESKNVITNELKSKYFVAGRLGSGYKIWTDEQGKTYAEFDKLLIRDEFVANKLSIAEITSVGGLILLTVANMHCIDVKEQTESYRCYFNNDNGAIPNLFVVGDQAVCQTITGANAKYYWRLVTGVGPNYIDLSKTDCDGTREHYPEPGDEIIQLGNRTNKDRQNAILISAYGSDAPAIKQYKGINSYSFYGCEKTVISDKYNKFTGDFYLETGESIATMLKIQEGVIYSEISSMRKEISAKDNLLKNASFSADTLYWIAVNDIKLYTVGGKLLSFNRNFYGNKNRTLQVVQDGSHLAIRIKNIGIKQLNANVAKPAKVILADGTTENPNFYLSFKYRCPMSGLLKIGFEGTPFYFERQIDATDEYMELELSGTWDLTGDFILSFNGEMYLNDLSLKNDKLKDYALFSMSQFTQTKESIKAVVQAIDSINNTIANAGWLTKNDKVKIWAMLTFGETNTTLESLFEVTANGIFLKSNHVDITGQVTFESFTPALQQAYITDISNAKMNAKNDIAVQLGFANYAQLVENAIVGKTLITGGFINSELIDVVTLLANKVIAITGKFNGSISAPFKEINDVEVTWDDETERIGHIDLDFNTGFNFAYAATVGRNVTFNLPTDVAYNGVFSDIFNKSVITKSGDYLYVSGNFIYRKMSMSTKVNKVVLNSNAILNLRAIVISSTLYWYVENSNEFNLSGTVLASN